MPANGASTGPDSVEMLDEIGTQDSRTKL